MLWVIPILFAAMAHAVWNFLVKQSANQAIFLWSMRVAAVLLFLPVLYLGHVQASMSIGFLLFGGGSVLLHGLYGVVLAKAYEDTDFSAAYPVARGTGPLFAAMAGWVLFNEPLSHGDGLGVLFIVIGLYVIHLPGLQLKAWLSPIQAIRHTTWPLLVGLSVAAYTIVDKLAVQFVAPALLNLLDNAGQVVLLTHGAWKHSGSTVGKIAKQEWFPIICAGVLSAVSYTAILISLQSVPMSQTAPIRESSIVIGTVLGTVVLKERYGAQRVLGSVLVLIGVASVALL